MSKNLSKYIASFEYLDKSLIVLSVATVNIPIASFATATGEPVGIMSASCGLAFSITTGFVKNLLKTIRNKKKKHNKIVMLARSKLNSIESKLSEALINNEFSHKDFMICFMKKRKIESWKKELKWWIVKEVMLKKLVWLKKAKKKIGINEVINRNEIINNSLK